MKLSADHLDSIPIHFILCTERTGSSLMSLMLNMNDSIICPSEEPFALYFYSRYQHKTVWTEKDIDLFVRHFFLLAEKNMDLYFASKESFKQNLKAHRDILNFDRLIKITYLHFFDTKKKDGIEVIVDKQIKYFFHLKELSKIFPNSKFIVLVRDVRDNIVSKKYRSLNWNQNPLFLASLWKDTYRQIHHIPSDKLKVVTYENLVVNTESTLRSVCSWLGVSFQSKMLQTEKEFRGLVESKKSLLNPIFYKKLLVFHEGLSQKPNTKKIGQYTSLAPKTLIKIEAICRPDLTQFGYKESQDHPKINFIQKYFYRGLSKAYRNYLLSIYYRIPLPVKLFIRKFKTKTTEA